MLQCLLGKRYRKPPERNLVKDCALSLWSCTRLVSEAVVQVGSRSGARARTWTNAYGNPASMGVPVTTWGRATNACAALATRGTTASGHTQPQT